MYGLRCQWFNKIADLILIKTSFISTQTKCIQLDSQVFVWSNSSLVNYDLVWLKWHFFLPCAEQHLHIDCRPNVCAMYVRAKWPSVDPACKLEQYMLRQRSNIFMQSLGQHCTFQTTMVLCSSNDYMRNIRTSTLAQHYANMLHKYTLSQNFLWTTLGQLYISMLHSFNGGLKRIGMLICVSQLASVRHTEGVSFN